MLILLHYEVGANNVAVVVAGSGFIRGTAMTTSGVKITLELIRASHQGEWHPFRQQDAVAAGQSKNRPNVDRQPARA